MPTDKKIKILHWPTSYPDPERGKPYDCIFVKEHILSVSPFCQNRVLFTSSDQPANGKLVEIVSTIENGIPTDRIYFKTVRPLWITNVYVRAILLFYFLKLILKERYFPDILHIHFHQSGLIALLFSKLFRIPMVVTEHWTAFIGFPEIPDHRFKKAEKVFKNALHILPVSGHLLKGIQSKIGIALSTKSTIVNNAVNAKLFLIKHIVHHSMVKTILVVARLDEQKDLSNLFNAIGLLKRKGLLPIQVIIIGKGDKSQYDKILHECNVIDDVIFLGEKDKGFIADQMSKADLLCLSSISENSPCVIGEALCTGLPVVSTDVGGIPELLNASNGLLVPPKDAERLAQAIETALFHQEFDREAISQQAQAHFSYDAIGSQIFNVYQKVLNQSPN